MQHNNLSHTCTSGLGLISTVVSPLWLLRSMSLLSWNHQQATQLRVSKGSSTYGFSISFRTAHGCQCEQSDGDLHMDCHS